MMEDAQREKPSGLLQSDFASLIAALTTGDRLKWFAWGKHDIDTQLDENFSAEVSSAVEAAIVWKGEEFSLYVVHTQKRGWFFRTYTARFYQLRPQHIERHPKQYKHLKDAKATCERHDATGEWE